MGVMGQPEAATETTTGLEISIAAEPAARQEAVGIAPRATMSTETGALSFGNGSGNRIGIQIKIAAGPAMRPALGCRAGALG